MTLRGISLPPLSIFPDSKMMTIDQESKNNTEMAVKVSPLILGENQVQYRCPAKSALEGMLARKTEVADLWGTS